MSWGYWGIVLGVGTLVMLFFATMAIIYSKQSESATRHKEDDRQEALPAAEGRSRSRAAA
ncbi:MAG: hypothetical protein KF814_02165 [Nitrospiraceae bacterium]|nr:hypothetical protein [Nitrospiraceae bacterium]